MSVKRQRNASRVRQWVLLSLFCASVGLGLPWQERGVIGHGWKVPIVAEIVQARFQRPMWPIAGGSITTAELILYGSANLPTDDVSTTGGAIDATMRPSFTQFTSAAVLSMTSSAADTRNVTIIGRVADGSYTTETKALNGTTEVLSTNTYERILSVKAASTNANTVTLKQGAGGTTIGTIPANEAGVYAQFINSFSTSSQQVRYEKAFWKNTDATLALLSAQVTLTADPTAITQIGLATSVNDSATVANRLSAPGGVSFVGLSSAINVPGTNLAAGAAIGMWTSQTLSSNMAAAKTTYTTQLSGQTT